MLIFWANSIIETSLIFRQTLNINTCARTRTHTHTYTHTDTVRLMWSLESGLLQWSTVRTSLMTASTSKRGEGAKPQSLCRMSRVSERLSSNKTALASKWIEFVFHLKVARSMTQTSPGKCGNNRYWVISPWCRCELMFSHCVAVWVYRRAV